MDKRATIHDVTQALSWALRYGIVKLPHVVSWTDFHIANNAENPLWILEISTVHNDLNAALSWLNEASQGNDFDMAFGLLAVLADDAVNKTPCACNTVLSSLVSVLRDQDLWMDVQEGSDAWDLYLIEDALVDGYGSEAEGRAAIAKYAQPYKAFAMESGMLQ